MTDRALDQVRCRRQAKTGERRRRDRDKQNQAMKTNKQGVGCLGASVIQLSTLEEPWKYSQDGECVQISCACFIRACFGARSSLILSGSHSTAEIASSVLAILEIFLLQ